MSDKRQCREWMPALYATYLGILKEVARKHGYALAVHGSLTRDMDLIAVPWVEDAGDPLLMLAEMRSRLGFNVQGETRPYDSMGEKPHGRTAYTVPTGGGGYMDISIMPRRETR